jgi:L-iditol 2-dehydrogenase
MRAVHVPRRGVVSLVDAPRPSPKHGEALIRTKLLSICGSDLNRLFHLQNDEYPLPIGAPGHEVIGEVVEVRSSEGRLVDHPAGDALALLPAAENAMAEYVCVPTENVVPLPPGVAAERLLMGQQLGTVIYALRKIPETGHRSAVIIGQGSAGLFFDAMLRSREVQQVIAMDLVDERVEAAREFGATEALNNARRDPAAFVEDATGGAMADLVVEASGDTGAINLAPKLVRPGGHLLYFGIPHKREFPFDFYSFFRAYCITVSSGASSAAADKSHTREALEHIAAGRVDVTPMLTHRFALEEVATAYSLAEERADGIIKAVIEMPGLREGL